MPDPTTRRRVTRRRGRCVPLFDPLLLLAALGLVACSLVTLKGATETTSRGPPVLLRRAPGASTRRSGWCWRWCCAGSTTRGCASTSTGLYARDDRAQPGRLRDADRSRAPAAGSRCRSSTSSPRSSARSCSSSRWPAFAVDRSRRLARAAHDRADHAAGADPGDARDPAARPRHRHWCTSSIGVQHPVLRRDVVEAARRAGGAVRGRRSRSCSPVAPALGVPRAQALPGAAADRASSTRPTTPATRRYNITSR